MGPLHHTERRLPAPDPVRGLCKHPSPSNLRAHPPYSETEAGGWPWTRSHPSLKPAWTPQNPLLGPTLIQGGKKGPASLPQGQASLSLGFSVPHAWPLSTQWMPSSPTPRASFCCHFVERVDHCHCSLLSRHLSPCVLCSHVQHLVKAAVPLSTLVHGQERCCAWASGASYASPWPHQCFPRRYLASAFPPQESLGRYRLPSVQSHSALHPCV